MLQGFTPPYTSSGKSSLMPAPPWHYAGRVVSFSLTVDEGAAEHYLPDGFGKATERSFGHFCEWQATTDGSELLDPAYAQYSEFFYLIEAEKDGDLQLFCPFIYVDQDISMVRGLLQGWPKKMGSVYIGRSYDLEHPAAGQISAGTKLGAALSVKGRRLAEAEWTYTGQEGEKLGFLATPTFGIVGTPSLVGEPTSGSQTLVRQAVSETAIGKVHDATGSLSLFESPRDEMGALAPIETTGAAVCDFALTVTGVTVANS